MSRHHQKPVHKQVWSRLRTHVINRDGWKCTQCGARYRLEVHHKVPIAEGGHSTPDNCITVCRPCHISLERERKQVHVVKGQSEWQNAVHGKRGNMV